MLKNLTTTSSAVETDLLEARLRVAGIPCMHGNPRSRSFRGRDILVEEEDLDRARAVLNEADGGFDEEELTRLSEEAGKAIQDGLYPDEMPTAEDQEERPVPVETRPAASRHGLLKTVERLAGHERPENPESPFGR